MSLSPNNKTGEIDKIPYKSYNIINNYNYYKSISNDLCPMINLM